MSEPQAGMLIQIDGSFHRWLGDHGPQFTLLLVVDDATSAAVNAGFSPEEDTQSYFTLMQALIEHWGYYAAQRRLKRWQRAQARRTPGSRGWWEAQRRIDATQRRIVGLRNNTHHHVSRALVGKYHTLGIETLKVAGMIRAGLQSKALSDAGMSSLLSQIRYKAGWYGTEIVEADRWYPSSRTCSVCGVVNPELGREPMWSCPSCGVIHPPQADNENADRPPEAEVNLRYSR